MYLKMASIFTIPPSNANLLTQRKFSYQTYQDRVSMLLEILFNSM